MFERIILASLREDLADYPAVALLGPRQAGKTTVALELASQSDHVYLDLESELDRAKLASPELYLAERLDRLVSLDEVHRVPRLFPVLRGLIDRARRDGRRSGGGHGRSSRSASAIAPSRRVRSRSIHCVPA